MLNLIALKHTHIHTHIHRSVDTTDPKPQGLIDTLTPTPTLRIHAHTHNTPTTTHTHTPTHTHCVPLSTRPDTASPTDTNYTANPYPSDLIHTSTSFCHPS